MVNEITKLKQELEHERNLNNNLRNALLGQDNADDVLKQAHTFKKQAESLQEVKCYNKVVTEVANKI